MLKLDDMSCIVGSFAPATRESIDNGARAFFDALPLEYKEFLARHNGGVVEEFAWTFDTGVPFKTDSADNPSRTDCVIDLFGIPTADPPDPAPEDLLQVAADRADDLGHVYYWDWYWQYPWCEQFSCSRVDAVHGSFPNAEQVLNDGHHPQYQQLIDELNYATLIRIATSWPEFLEKCRDERELSEET